jgi:hypothetical protein
MKTLMLHQDTYFRARGLMRAYMRKFVLRALCLLILVMGCTEKDQEIVPAMMGDLALGSYQVGYQTLFLYDETRLGVPFSDWKGNLYHNHDPALGRQFQINIWYPSKTGTGTPINYSHYVHLMGRQTNFEDSETNRLFGEQVMLNQTNDLGAGGKFGADELDELMQLKVLSRLAAVPLEEQFPVVAFPNGSNPASHSIMAEYLTSHGYVVVGFAPKGRFSSSLEISTIGIETGVDDLEYVLGKIGDLPFADLNNVTIAGNAIASSIGAAAVSRNQKIKAMASIEGGLPSAFEQRLLSKSVFYEAENIQVPSLFIYAPHPSINPTYTYHLKYAKRHYAHFPHMSEFVMLNYGMFDQFVPDIIGSHTGSTQGGFETACLLLRRFLDKYLKHSDLALFDQAFLDQSQGIIDTTFTLEPLAAAPNIAELKDLFNRRGFAAIDSVYHSLKSNGNNQPFSRSFYRDYRAWLSWGKDDTYQLRYELYQLAYDSYPKSSMVNYHLGLYAHRSMHIPMAMTHYAKSMELLADDDDVLLTTPERKRIKANAENALKDLVK